MISLLLVIIYIAFISLGLPDSLLGAAWPAIYKELDVPISFAGIISMIIAGGTIISSLLSDRITKKLGTGVVTVISVAMTAIALFGFSISQNFIFLCLWAIPYGLGAGAIDAALNNYLALHYSSKHMNWLHCFWGVGAAISPYIMGYYLTSGAGWNQGYRAVFYIQALLTIVLIISLPLWKKPKLSVRSKKAHSLKEVLQTKNIKYVLIAFLAYCGLESSTGLWASSYLVEYRGIKEDTAALFASFFFLGITVGRFLSGFIADKVGDKKMLRFGILIAIFGIILISLPFATISLIGLIITGLGCAPIFPSIIHSTPTNFGEDKSQAIIGVQMASAYVGTTFMPPLFGLIASKISIGLYPVYLSLLLILMIAASERFNRKVPLKEAT